jgi:serine/threonine-protein kinase
VKPLSDAAVARLRDLIEQPLTSGGRYEILDRLGEGGMGAVYLAIDRELNREVAVKVLRNAAPTPEEHERLMREARVLASLEHPGIVPVHDLGALDDGRVFYVMKRVRGDRLDDFARAPRPRSELLRVFLQICDAVAFAHSAHVIHRDLKPQNVMLGPCGEVLVLDWGVAKARHLNALISASPPFRTSSPVSPDGSTGSGSVIGTPGYMAPEQLAGEADERADVYGLGGILIFLLTGMHPAAANNSSSGAEDCLRGLPPALRAVCEHARAADPSQRYGDVAALRADIAAYLEAMPVAAHRESLVDRASRLASRHRTALLLVGAYLLVRIALLIFART